jgi:peptide/nickel transport system ATP-binding protein
VTSGPVSPASAPAIAPAAAGNDAPPLLEVAGLCTYFFTADGVVRAVDDLSLEIRPGEILGVVGESGYGKSMTGLSILRLVDEPGRVVAGSIRFRGEDLAKLSPAGIRAVRGAGIGMVFQDPMTSLNPVKRVAAQIVEAIRAHRPVDKPEARGRAVALLKRMGVPAPERAVEAFPHQFSGGMRQRVVMAIGSANQPDLLIADEPTTALDVTVQREILALLRELANEAHTAIMLITHNLGVVAATCDRVAVMYAGEIVETGPAETVLSHASHPYTQSLLNAVPRLDRPAAANRRLAIVDGVPPDSRTVIPGCRFQPRCPYAREICGTHPALLSVEGGHESRCWVAQAGETPWRVAEPVAATPRAAEARSASAPLLVAEHLTKEFGVGRGLGRSTQRVTAVDDVSFAIAHARTLGLVGESGSGKSTIARLLTRLMEPTGGSILFEGRDITTLSSAELRPVRSRLQMIFQDPYASLNPRMTVFETVAEAYRFHHPGAASADVTAKVEATLARVGLGARGHRDRYPHEFSGGQRQRIGIARSLIVDPSFIIADEPVSALDVNVQGQIINLLVELQEENDLTYLLIAHDLALVRHVCDEVAVMYLGKIVEWGAAAEVFEHPRHPYSRLLIDSAPIPDVAAERRRAVWTGIGEMPSPLARPSGCVFRTRCPFAQAICAEVEPKLEPGDGAHKFACHFPLGT